MEEDASNLEEQPLSIRMAVLGKRVPDSAHSGLSIDIQFFVKLPSSSPELSSMSFNLDFLVSTSLNTSRMMTTPYRLMAGGCIEH
jgi:hypothetical protein